MAVATFYLLLISVIALALAIVSFAIECIERRQKIKLAAEQNRKAKLEIENKRIEMCRARTMLECDRFNEEMSK